MSQPLNLWQFAGRWLKHAFAWRPSYLAVFNPACLTAMMQAVQRSEANHAAQICIVSEHTLPRSYLRRAQSVRQRAIMLFSKQRVWDTANNAGVLIYINYVERAVELVADRGLSENVAQAQWDEWAQTLRSAYALGQFEAGTIAVIDSMAVVFAKALPQLTEQTASVNLPDRPQVL